MAEVDQGLINCHKNCGADIVCFEECFAIFKEEMKECPCMENCPLGCPCSGFVCEPYITAMCQGTKKIYNFIDFSYSISSSGHYKEKCLKKYYNFPFGVKLSLLNFYQENRHYTTPAKTDYQFLYRSGFSILNGEVYIFGGYQDLKKVYHFYPDLF